MPFGALLDACALHPAHLRDTLLRLAERRLYRACWSSKIIDELSQSLKRREVHPDSVDRLVAQIRTAFPDSEVTGYGSLIRSMICNEKDRHVLAAAVRGNADVIVTFNVKDFPLASTNPYDIEVKSPDVFLLDLLDLAPKYVLTEIRSQADANVRQPCTFTSLLTALARAGVPMFAEEVAQRSQ